MEKRKETFRRIYSNIVLWQWTNFLSQWYEMYDIILESKGILADQHILPPVWALALQSFTVMLQCSDTLGIRLPNNGSGGIYHRSINTSVSSSSPWILPLINQQTSPRGSTLQLSCLFSVRLHAWGYNTRALCSTGFACDCMCGGVYACVC